LLNNCPLLVVYRPICSVRKLVQIAGNRPFRSLNTPFIVESRIARPRSAAHPLLRPRNGAGCVPSETAATRITGPDAVCLQWLHRSQLAGGADHYLDSAVALATQLVGIIALGPFRAETARLDPVS
jgi:hypothetical protein